MISITKAEMRKIAYDFGDVGLVYNPAARSLRRQCLELGKRTQYVSLGRAKSYTLNSKNSSKKYPKNIRII